MSSMVRVCLSNLNAFSKKKLVALGKLNPRYYGAIADGKEVDLKAIFKRKKDKLEGKLSPFIDCEDIYLSSFGYTAFLEVFSVTRNLVGSDILQ